MKYALIRIRIIQELGDWTSAVEAYGKGLSTLASPDIELSPAQKEMKGQLESRLRVAEQQAANPQRSLLIHSPESTTGNRPWDRAQMLVDELQIGINNGEPEATSSSVSFLRLQREKGTYIVSTRLGLSTLHIRYCAHTAFISHLRCLLAVQSFAAGVKKMKNLKETISQTGKIVYDSENGVSNIDKPSKSAT